LRRRLGKFELANTGTLFLDEVGDLSPHGQVALLRVLQQKEFTRIGGEDSVSVDVRVIAATNRQLSKMVGEGRFRADLFHRLNQTTLIIPPLRERRDDIPLLVEKIFSRLRVQLNRPLVGVTPGFMKKLTAHPWPGNVRELEHALCQSALMETTPVLTGEYFSRHQEQQREGNNLNHQEEIFLLSKSAKKSRLKEILIQSKGNKSRAAAALGITRYTLYSWLKEAQDKENGEEGFSR
jgi:transcriptional regulator with PAS, ATPase and Fis domain